MTLLAPELEKLLTSFSPHSIVETLAPYVTADRQRRIATVIAGRMQSIQIAVEAPCDPRNAAAIVRTAEALGISQVHVIAAEGNAKALRSPGATQGAFRWVHLTHYDAWEDFIPVVSTNQLSLAGAMMDGDKTVTDLPIDKPLCLLLGNENRGLSPTAKSACDHAYRIPMTGFSESLNLSVSAAISLYDVLTRKRTAINQQTDLSEADALAETARFYMQSVSQRLLLSLLKPSV